MMTLRYQESEEATNELFSLACGPQSMKSYPCCVINGVCFWVRRDKRLAAPNPGLHILRKIEDEVIELFGLATNVIELVYKLEHRVVLFSCEWFNTNPNENLIEMENNLINICVSSKWYGDDPFVLADEAVQVFYVDDQKCRPNWRLVQGGKYTVSLNPKPIHNSENESNRNSAALAQSIENISDGKHERVRTAPQHSTSVSCTTSSPRETSKEQPKEFVGTLETELESERALWASQKAELESRRALAQVQKSELDCQRALILTRKVELESQRALTLSQKAELESRKALSQRQQTELESQRLLTKYQQAELESTRRLIQGQNKLYQDQQQLLKDQQERLKHFENFFT
ncbi:hypothetical protein MKX03_009554 [Papaver bracteatum]|nr:hypothetical protein MKX03_009554 [Papaver bracteatum]